MSSLVFSIEMLDHLFRKFSGWLSDDTARALKYFVDHQGEVKITTDGNIIMSNELVEEALHSFGSAIRRNGSCQTSQEESGFKFASHAREQIIKYGLKLG